MKKLFTTLLSLVSFISLAQNDTIHVQAQEEAQLTWYGNYDATAAFPEGGSYEEITMDFTLGCSEGGCSHWDYTVSIYLMEPTGFMDSTVASLDTVVFEPLEVDTTWNVYEVQEKFELGRLITPYGNYMDWNQPSDPNDIFESSWERVYQFDVTDYAALLTDSSLVRVHFGGWPQEGRGFSASINFNFVEGVPAREVLSIENMYPVGGYSYESLADDVNFPTLTKSFDETVEGVAIKSYVSGHGHEGPQNCCEWVSKQHGIAINNEEFFQWNVWKDCGANPLYPQGGTWPFDRAGWCPGTKVDLEVSELTEFIDLSSEVDLDYRVQPYSANGEQSGSFIVSNTLFTYGAINFENDIELSDIIKPTTKDAWSRMNPICANPMVELRNRGSEFLTSATIEYGLEGGELSTYEWSGALDFLETTWVELPIPNWTGATEDSKFIATVIMEGDEYPTNNTKTSEFDIPEVLPNQFVFEFRTQSTYQGTNRAAQSSYQLMDINGDVVYERSGNLEPSTWYKDTIQLAFGCYELVFEDAAEDGVNEHWYYGESSGGAGKVQIRDMEGTIFKKFPDDFGQQIDYRFTVTYLMQTGAIEEGSFELYPNPADNYLSVSLSLAQTDEVDFAIYNNLGEELDRVSRRDFSVGSEQFDTSSYAAGIYYCKVITSESEQVKKFIVAD